MEERKVRGEYSKLDKKKSVFHLRLSDEDAYFLDFLARKKGKNKSDILREALKIQYRIARNTF